MDAVLCRSMAICLLAQAALVVVAAAAGGGGRAARVSIYVDPVSGRDPPGPATGAASDGGQRAHRDGEVPARRPLRTLGAAQRAARAALGRAGGNGGVTVHAAAGRYDPLSLSELDAGAIETANVLFEGAPGATISAGRVLSASGFGPVPSSDPVFARLPAPARAATHRFDLGALGISAKSLQLLDRLSPTVAGPGGTGSLLGPDSVQLTCDGVAMDLASWPSNGSWAHTGENVSHNGFVYPPDAPLPDDSAGLWLAGYFIYDWSDARIPVESVVRSNRTLFANTTAAHYVRTGGQFVPEARFRFLNLPEFLSAAGQFWLDPTTDYLYIVGQQQRRSSCTLAVGASALQVADTSHITIAGFVLESTTGSVATVTDSSFISVRNCTVRGGMAGIEVVGGHHVSVSDVEAHSIGGAAISISGGDRPTLTRGNHSVTNCTIHDFARVLWCCEFDTLSSICHLP